MPKKWQVRNNTIDQATQSLKAAAPTGIPSTGNILLALWEKASPSLNQEALKWFAGATEQAENVAESLQSTVDGIANLVATDTRAGDFQSSDDVPALLLTIANGLDNIRGLFHVGERASHRLHHPELYRE